MRYLMDSGQVLANALVVRPAITIKELKKLAALVEEKVPSVCIDISRQSLSAALDDYPTLFERSDDITISRRQESGDRFERAYVDMFFNVGIPPSVKTSVVDLLQAIER